MFKEVEPLEFETNIPEEEFKFYKTCPPSMYEFYAGEKME